MEWEKFSAKTVDDAVLEAAIKLGTTRDNIEYEVVFHGSSGFLGIGSKDAVINARLKVEEEDILEEIKQDLKLEKPLEKKPERKPEKKPERKPEKKQEKTEQKKPAFEEKPVAVLPKEEEKPEKPVEKEPAKPKTPLDDQVSINVEEFLKKVFAAMELEVELRVLANKEEREINVELNGQDMGVLIGKRGQTLDSLQYLTSLVANKETNEYIRVKVDTENYRERRKETLENLAKNISFKVKRTRKPVTLEPMNPYERRVIHSALQNDKFVSTHSEGEEPYRHVVVTLKEGVKIDNYNNKRRNNYNRNRNNHRRRER
ncbi:MAG: protein jag [Lachnospiraceae bacterium]|nr:protein jag [Lachnospiraceae bacterium]